MVTEPIVKPAGYFWQFVLERAGFDAVYAPNGRIYVRRLVYHGLIEPDVIDNRPGAITWCRATPRRSWLIEHEKAHAYQCARDGWLRFWIGICWAYVSHGHAASPYEIEANDIADMSVGW